MLVETINTFCSGNIELNIFKEDGKLRVVIKTSQKTITIQDSDKRPEIKIK